MSEAGNRAGMIRRMNQGDLDRVLAWRNHADVRRFMFAAEEITTDEHEQWFLNASSDPCKHPLIYEEHGLPLGFANFSRAQNGTVADWGFYMAPEAPRGRGKMLGAVALEYAFSVIGVHKVCGQVLEFNTRSTHLHLKLGFKQEGVLREQHFNGAIYHDVICFGLLAQEWRSYEEAK